MRGRARKSRHLRELEAKAAAFDALEASAVDHAYDGELTRWECAEALLAERRKRGLAPPPPPLPPPAPPFIGPELEPEERIRRFAAACYATPSVAIIHF